MKKTKRFRLQAIIATIMLIGFVVLGMCYETSYAQPYPANTREALELMHTLAHRSDYCAKEMDNGRGMVTPYRTKDRTWNPIAFIQSISHNIPATLAPGQVVNASITVSLGTPSGCPVIYDSVFADWSPDIALGEITYTFCSATTQTVSFTFEAPLVRGKYRIRWMHASSYRPVHSFFCGFGGTYQNPADPDYMRSPNAWMEVPIEVVP